MCNSSKATNGDTISMSEAPIRASDLPESKSDCALKAPLDSALSRLLRAKTQPTMPGSATDMAMRLVIRGNAWPHTVVPTVLQIKGWPGRQLVSEESA